MKQDKKLTLREQRFCEYYAKSADTEQSAINAGYTNHPKQKGEQLLSRSDIVDKIATLAKNQQKLSFVTASIGYQRLAFGNIADAISLLFMDKPTASQLKSMDLYSVSEIKKPKEGAMEIKFFDRLKALEKLSLLQNEQNQESGSLIDALYMGAKMLNDCNEDDENGV